MDRKKDLDKIVEVENTLVAAKGQGGEGREVVIVLLYLISSI